MKRHKTPDEVIQMLAMRAVGFTICHIARRMGVSERTVERHLAEHGARKGILKQSLIEEARRDLLSVVKNDEAVLNELAKLIHDDIAITAKLRSVMLEATEKLNPTNLEEAALVMRALAAASTTLKNTSDTTRHSLSTKKLNEQSEEIPVLEIIGITDEEAMNMHRDKMMATVDADMGDEAQDDGEED